MNSNTEPPLESQSIEKEKADLKKEFVNSNNSSATSHDIPEFGWSGYAERINGRFAMIGFTSILLIEAISKTSFLDWAGILPIK